MQLRNFEIAVGKVVRRHDVADGHDVQGRAEEALFNKSPEYEAADAAETIDSDFDCHGMI